MGRLRTDFLSSVLYWVVIIGLVLLTLTLVTLPWTLEIIFRGSTFYSLVPHYKILILLYVTGIPMWIILWMTKILARNIIKRDPFSISSCLSLKGISICALIIFICYLFTCLFVRATFGIIVITIGAFGVALIAAILYRLVGVAIEIKEENELTI
ncbi:DUF2975 domain-containing protein [Cellulosilyticum ruminicola]|uniref:DUF2975 domain-containing protein n=1 Tax=Cellulosilyticum ruminicola TaxID=425254 RepID=UPI0006D15354|nr:DUF2975 domain-containing protein [Cellulosilyticum ruminicola]